MILLARTDPEAPKHREITYFIVDMKSLGIQVRPLINMADSHEFNEVFFEDVQVPKDNVIGEENRGWHLALTTLSFERSNIGSAIGARQSVEDLVAFACDAGRQSTLSHNRAVRLS
jgi:alkylation response protein AidB-like acyl-CoA dehydrogenase